jgi:Flp pilus assembly protein TadG
MKVRTKIRQEDGAAAVEFALIVGVLAMLIFGMLQFGLAFFELQNLRAASREGARLGAVGATPAEIRDRVNTASNNAIPANNPAITITPLAGCPAPASQTIDSKVAVAIDTANAALPANLKDIFTINVPFLPPIVTHPAIRGEFRCEGVSQS